MGLIDLKQEVENLVKMKQFSVCTSYTVYFSPILARFFFILRESKRIVEES